METQLLAMLALAVTAVYASYRLRLHPLVGYVIAGLLATPFVPAGAVTKLAELGVILLMFTIGLEFSTERIIELRRLLVIGGSIQVGVTTALIAAVLLALGQNLSTAFLLGVMVALSSTAIVASMLQERDELITPHGRMTMGILLFQDIIAIPILLAVPLLAGHATTGWLSIIEGVAALGLAYVLARRLADSTLHEAARTRSGQLFLMLVLLTCFSFAFLAQHFGISPAFGAFLAGLAVAGSSYHSTALSTVLPFKDLLTGLFFISIGMLLQPAYLAVNVVNVLALTITFILLKFLGGALASRALGAPFRTMLLTGGALAQVGEFSLIIGQSALAAGILGTDTYTLFLSAAVLSMLSASVILPSLSSWFPTTKKPGEHSPLSGHLLIIGYGMTGTILHEAAKKSGIAHAIIDMNPDTIRKVSGTSTAVYGDASQPSVLSRAGAATAKVITIGVSDSKAAERIVANARAMNASATIIVRGRTVEHAKTLLSKGADEAIPEEFETSLEIFSRVMRAYLVSEDDIDTFTASIRGNNYQMLRSKHHGFTLQQDMIRTECVREGARAAGKSLDALGMRKQHGVSVLAVRRGKEMFTNPESGFTLSSGDTVILFGTPEHMGRACRLFTHD